MCHKNSNYKKAGVATLISDNIDFKTKMLLDIKRDIYNNSSVHQKKHAPTSRTPNDMKQKMTELKGNNNFWTL